MTDFFGPRGEGGDGWAVRKALAGDACTLAALAERTFRATFGPTNDALNVDVHCDRSYDTAIQATEIADPLMATLVCDHAGILVGYAQLRWGSAPACVIAQRPAEIQRIYVDEGWHGQGVAQALMVGMLELAAEGAADCAWLGVWELNPRAQAFYAKFGFERAGDHQFVLGHEVQRDLVLVRRPLRVALESEA